MVRKSCVRFWLRSLFFGYQHFPLMDDLLEVLKEWLDSDDPIKQRHAQFRLAQADAKLEYPALLQQAANVAQAAGSALAAAVRGEPISVVQEEQERRLAICHECEFWDAAGGRCSRCGCFGQWKTWLATQHCPIKRW
jgi:hypothetical protein